MTECERLIRKGIISESFLKEETICDYVVTNKMKKNWAVGLDLLVEFDKVCRKHNLKYFMAFGSLLGVVRHKGFIPWDDDVDVCMLRDDYDKLLQLSEEFQHPYFLQVPSKDNGYYFSHTKLRNSNTSAVSLPFRYEKFNQGIALDIFVLDNCVKETAEDIWNQQNEINKANSAVMRASNLFPSESDKARIRQHEGVNPTDLINRSNYLATCNSDKNTDIVICASLTVYKHYKLMWKKSDLEELIEVNFYGHLLYIPKNYDAILSTTYGDYMKYPPVEERGCWHNNEIIDADVPYTNTVELLKQKDLETNSL